MFALFTLGFPDLSFLFQDQFTIIMKRGVYSTAGGPLSRGKRHPYYVMHCTTPCASGDFRLEANLDAYGRVTHGSFPEIPGKFSNFGGREIVYSTVEVRLFSQFFAGNAFHNSTMPCATALDLFVRHPVLFSCKRFSRNVRSNLRSLYLILDCRIHQVFHSEWNCDRKGCLLGSH